MTVLITLTTAGTDSGPFDLYSNLDGFTVPFETGVSKASLLGGYSSAFVPNYTGTIRVKSVGDCVNYIDINLTASTSSTSSTSSTTTVAPPTTTAPPFYSMNMSNSVPALPCFDPGIPNTFPITIYVDNVPVGIGDIIYLDNGLSIPFNGDGTWYWVAPFQAYQINASGVVLATQECGI